MSEPVGVLDVAETKTVTARIPATIAHKVGVIASHRGQSPVEVYLELFEPIVDRVYREENQKALETGAAFEPAPPKRPRRKR